MKIEDCTQTKDGHSVRIYATDGKSGNMIYGAIWVNGWELVMWNEAGIKIWGPGPVLEQYDLFFYNWRYDLLLD